MAVGSQLGEEGVAPDFLHRVEVGDHAGGDRPGEERR